MLLLPEKNQPTGVLRAKAYGISYRAMKLHTCAGGYAEMILLRAGTSIFRIPDTLPTEAVVGAGCALTTAIHGLERGPVNEGDIVVINRAADPWDWLRSRSRRRRSFACCGCRRPRPQNRARAPIERTPWWIFAVYPDLAARREKVLSETTPYGADVVIECVGFA